MGTSETLAPAEEEAVSTLFAVFAGTLAALAAGVFLPASIVGILGVFVIGSIGGVLGGIFGRKVAKGEFD